MMRKSIALLTVLLVLLPGFLTAQTAKKATPAKAQAVLEYSDDETQLVITDAKGNPLVPSDGLVLPVGTVIKTMKTTAEIRLNPNGSIIKLSASTTFKIESLKETDGTGSNDFAILGGKIRTVAAKLTGSTVPGYNVRTPTANCGVRGTDFAMKFDPDNAMDWVCVQEGQVEFTNINTGETVPVGTGQFANTFNEVFQAGAVSAERLAELFADLDFVKLSPVEVPAAEIAAVTEAAPVEAAPAAEKAPASEPAAAAPAEDPMMEFLKKFFGLEVGSITIEGSTYSKAVLTPVVTAEGFRLGLYLPIVYRTDLFNANEWYRPAGNDEWSFGTDKSGWANIAADAGRDLALKIKYLEWGNQGSDPFYLSLGNLKTMTIGHGSVVHNFANDQDFPAIRKIGVNAGAKLGPLALEGLTDDLADPTVVGGRLALDLVGDQIVFGVQTTADLRLADPKNLSAFNTTPQAFGDPILLVGGVDLQLFKLDFGAFRTKAFADVNTVVPYLRSDSIQLKSTQGLLLKTAWDGSLGSLGGETGFMGNLAIMEYRLTFQAERGLYSNGLFEGNYYRNRTNTLFALKQYLLDPAAALANLDMGIYGSAGFDVFGLLKMQAAYRWPFVLTSTGSIQASDSDFFQVGLSVPKDKIPFVKLSGSVVYARTQFVPSLRDKVNLFDANTVLRGEVVYGLATGLDLAVGVSTSTLRDSAGNILYDNNKPKVGPVISLDTRVSL